MIRRNSGIKNKEERIKILNPHSLIINRHLQRGFTLIEALVVIGVLAVLGYVMTDLLSRTLLGGNKTELNDTIKQNGERALTTMDSTIREADQVVCTSSYSATNDTIVVVKNGTFTRFRIFPQTTGANGYIVEDNPLLSNPTNLTSICNNYTQNSPQTITDTDPVTGVSIPVAANACDPTNGCFYDQKASGYKDVVQISFYLSPGINLGTGSQNTVGTNNRVNFSTKVELR